MQPVKPIADEVPVCCPSCKAIVWLVRGTTNEVPGDQVWLLDGDCIPGVSERLRPDQLEPEAFEAMLTVGQCPACNQGYYVAEACFMEGPNDQIMDWMGGFIDESSQHNFVCQIDPAAPTWILQHLGTSMGPVNQHLFGPFAVDLNELTGPIGVAACGNLAKTGAWGAARDLLVNHWDAMREINARAAELAREPELA